MAAYASAEDLIARFDSRILGDLVNDANERLSEAEIIASERVETALSAASGQVNSHVLRGNRYTESDLTSLTGNDLEFLKDIVCTLAFMWLHRRRSWVEISDSHKEAAEYVKGALADLSQGKLIFNVSETRDAGVVSVEAVSRVEITRDWALLRDRCTGFYPPRRSYRNS